MSATNATTYYELPVFIATDKPAWLTDWNGAMNAIDTAIKEALTAGENAQTTANTATSSIATINDSLTTINTSLTTLTSTVTGLTGSVNTINSLIGNGEPTTSDKTLIGAINEIYAMIGGGTEVDADIVAYDNTTSGLTATNVQDAIDELAQGGSATVDADDVTYSNTASGLSATNVQDAIDEVNGKIDFDFSAHSGNVTISSTLSTSQNNVVYEMNADKSILRLSGGTRLLNVTPQAVDTDELVGSFVISDLPTISQAIDITLGTMTSFAAAGGTTIGSFVTKLKIKTDKTVEIYVNSDSTTAQHLTICLPAVLVFIS